MSPVEQFQKLQTTVYACRCPFRCSEDAAHGAAKKAESLQASNMIMVRAEHKLGDARWCCATPDCKVSELIACLDTHMFIVANTNNEQSRSYS